jgi:hypothetical protein
MCAVVHRRDRQHDLTTLLANGSGKFDGRMRERLGHFNAEAMVQ